MIPLINLSYIFVFLLLIEVFILKVNFSSPSFIFTGSFTLCSISTLFISTSWNFYYLSEETFNVIFISSMLFVVVEEIVRLSASLSINSKKQKIIARKSRNRIPISPKILYFTIAMSIVGLLWTSYYIYGFIRSGDWVRIMAEYKDTVNQDVSSLGQEKVLLNQIMKISTVTNYILLLVYNINSINGVFKRGEKKLYIISFILFLLFRFFLSGGRQGVFFFLVAWLTCYYILNTYSSSKKKLAEVNLQYFKILLLVITIVLPLFYFMGRAAGRKESDIIFEAAFGYLSSGIYGFEQIVSQHYSSHYWGAVSFPNLYSMLKFFDIIPQNLKDLGFLPFFNHGNTVSIIGRWYWDFGDVGVYIMTIITSFFYSILYYYGIYLSNSMRNRNIAIILYCILVYALYFAGYDDFIMAIISFNYFLIIILVVIFYILLIPKLKTKKIVIYLDYDQK